MNRPAQPPLVGAPDPELKTSPILEETDEDADALAQEAEDLDVCYYNNVAFGNGEYVCSGGGELLHCVDGIWIRDGSCDPEHP